MMRNRKFLFMALLAGVFAWGLAGCSDDDSSTGPECGDGECNGDETLASCPSDCDPCNQDGVCDPGESCTLCTPNGGANPDCCTVCDLPSMTGTDNDFIVNELFLPTSAAAAGSNGVDIDGDGDIDNKLGQIIQLLVTNGLDGDLNESLNAEIAEGSLLLATRVKESGQGDGVVAVQILQADLIAPDATPIFDGQDTVLIPSDSPQNLYLCGEWDGGPSLETSPASVTLAFPLPEIGLLEVTLSSAQIRTVTDMDSEYYATSSVTGGTTGNMTDVMIGGGLSQEEIYGPGGLIEFLAGFIQDMIDEGGNTATTITNLFDGNCVVVEDIAGCEAVVAGEGECAEDGAITATELKCNGMLSAALGPDVDSDGDGVNDLLSLGLRIASAVPVTLEFE